MEQIEKKLSGYPVLSELISEDQNPAYYKQLAQQNHSAETLETIFGLIDLTTLDVTDNLAKIEALCLKVNTLYDKYPGLTHVAAICVYPNFVSAVKENLSVDGVQIASVVGGFPASQTFLEIKLKEAVLAAKDGATEADMVISVGELLVGNYQKVYDEIVAMKNALGRVHLKVILETGALDQEQIFKASLIAMEAEADFIKTSTGKISPAATPEAAIIMSLAIREFEKKHAKKIGFKPAGGIATSQDALIYYSIVKEILGQDWLHNKMFRIGASRLATNLLKDICNLKGIEFKGF